MTDSMSKMDGHGDFEDEEDDEIDAHNNLLT